MPVLPPSLFPVPIPAGVFAPPFACGTLRAAGTLRNERRRPLFPHHLEVVHVGTAYATPPAQLFREVSTPCPKEYLAGGPMNKGNLSICMDFASMRRLMQVIGGDIGPYENRTTWLYRIAETTGLHYRVIRAVWHREQISKETAIALKKAAKKYEQQNNSIAQRLEWRAVVLAEIDADFYRAEIDGFRQLAHRIRNLNAEEG
jgi:hypothetical protein